MTNIILGTHNGINLIRKDDGSEFYYSTKTKKTAIGVKGLSRLLGLNPQTVLNAYNTLLSGKVISLLEPEMYTESGIKVVKLIKEEDLPKILTELSTGRKGKKTKESAIKMQETFSQAGFRLMVMLEVAPEEVAKEAINHITDTSKAKEVKIHAEVQEKYLESFHGLQDAIQKTGANYGAINGHNNRLVGIDNGASAIQKRMLQMIQTAEELKLEANREAYENGWHATNSAKKAGTETVEFLNKMLAG